MTSQSIISSTCNHTIRQSTEKDIPCIETTIEYQTPLCQGCKLIKATVRCKNALDTLEKTQAQLDKINSSSVRFQAKESDYYRRIVREYNLSVAGYFNEFDANEETKLRAKRLPTNVEQGQQRERKVRFADGSNISDEDNYRAVCRWRRDSDFYVPGRYAEATGFGFENTSGVNVEHWDDDAMQTYDNGESAASTVESTEPMTPNPPAREVGVTEMNVSAHESDDEE